MYCPKLTGLSSVILASYIFFSATSALCAPQINSYSGDLTHGGIVTITGIGFGVKSPAPPIIWADFENGTLNPSPLGQRTSWSTANEDTNFKINNTNSSLNSTYNAIGEWQPGVASFSFSIDKTTISPWTTIYNYQKRYYTFDSTANQKFWRLWPPYPNTNDFLAENLLGEGRCYNELEANLGQLRDTWQGTPYIKNMWNTEEFIWQHSGGTGLNIDGSPGSGGTGIWDYTRNGIQIQHRENVKNGSNNHTQLRTDNFTDSTNLPSHGSKVIMDNIYIDDTYARVMVGNGPTISSSTRREIQIPSVWSDTSVTVMLNQGSFISFSGAYLYIFDANGRVNTIGHPLCPECPSTPTNLRVQ